MNAHRAGPDGGEGAAERAAAEWALRVRGGLRADERRDLDAWLRRDARHAAIFAEMEEASRLLDRLRDPALAGARVVPFAVRAEPAVAPVRRRPRWLVPAGLAAALALAAGGIFGARFLTARENYVASLATEVGSSRAVKLPDGSVLQLNTGSVVQVAYTAAERRVRLKRGEAFFSVAKNPQRPFWVDVGSVSVRAVGTAFNVRFRPQSVEVLVKEGKVSVNPVAPAPAADPEPRARTPAAEHLLVAGEQATVSLPTAETPEPPPVVVAAVAAPRLESALAWQKGRLEFADTPLAEVVAEFNRYNRHQLAIADASLGAKLFGGAFASGGHEAFVEVLEQSFGVVAERRGGETVLRLRPAAGRAN